jgi:hypothetical protein
MDIYKFKEIIEDTEQDAKDNSFIIVEQDDVRVGYRHAFDDKELLTYRASSEFFELFELRKE